MHERKVNILCITNKIFTISNEHKAVIMDTAEKVDIRVTFDDSLESWILKDRPAFVCLWLRL